MLDQCLDCRVDLEDRGTDVRCWKCGRTWHAARDSRANAERSEAIAEREEFIARRH